jgi:hypothetical protein
MLDLMFAPGALVVIVFLKASFLFCLSNFQSKRHGHTFITKHTGVFKIRDSSIYKEVRFTVEVDIVH